MSRSNDAENLAGVRVLDAVEFDVSGAGPQPAAPGKTAAPVTVLAGVPFTLGQPPVVPSATDALPASRGGPGRLEPRCSSLLPGAEPL